MRVLKVRGKCSGKLKFEIEPSLQGTTHPSGYSTRFKVLHTPSRYSTLQGTTSPHPSPRYPTPFKELQTTPTLSKVCILHTTPPLRHSTHSAHPGTPSYQVAKLSRITVRLSCGEICKKRAMGEEENGEVNIMLHVKNK